MVAARIVLVSEIALVVAGIAWMLLTVRRSVRVSGVRRTRHELLQPTRELLTAAALSLAAGWSVSRHEVPNLLTLAILGVLLPATAGMGLALLVRQEGALTGNVRGWLVLAVPVVGGGAAGLAPHMF
ncbi:hypothetical protein [Streptomyces sp. SudanB182_2057]|uniref:hypothetical protein n=1 Tax=Streptomyces sp. SudanB182_2057 TaxID=3035281 RepID=UPI003F5587CF